VFRYRVRICSLVSSSSSCHARAASRIFRENVCSSESMRCFTYCWVIVEPPSSIRPVLAFT
jgi:hypothetical protein